MPENCAKFIREIRKEKGLTQSQMAADGSVCLPTQQNYEAGLRLPTGKYLQALALKGYDIVYLLTGQHQQCLSTKTADLDQQADDMQTGIETGRYQKAMVDVSEERLLHAWHKASSELQQATLRVLGVKEPDNKPIPHPSSNPRTGGKYD